MSSVAAHHGSADEPPRPARPHSALRDPVTATLWHHTLAIEPGPGGSIALLSLAGEIDMLTLPLVCAALVMALETRAADLVVDLGAVRFCGVRGFAMLAAVGRATAAEGIGSAVSGVGPHLDGGARQVWSDQPVVCYVTLSAAVIAIRRDQPRRCAGHP
jgi:anti-anti-sigma regulatory factor